MLGWPAGTTATVRDLWAKTDFPVSKDRFPVKDYQDVEAHSTLLLRPQSHCEQAILKGFPLSCSENGLCTHVRSNMPGSITLYSLPIQPPLAMSLELSAFLSESCLSSLECCCTANFCHFTVDTIILLFLSYLPLSQINLIWQLFRPYRLICFALQQKDLTSSSL